jgi:ATP-binding cassette subfamily F protein uup
MKEQKMAQRIEKPAKEEKSPGKEKKLSAKPSFRQLKDFETLEREIHELETEKNRVMDQMNSGKETAETFTILSLRYNELIQMIDDKTLAWMELGEIIENAKG